MENSCEFCGKVFSYRGKRVRKFCSHECYANGRKGKKFTYRNSFPTVKICPTCGKTFETGGRNRPRRAQVFCSAACQGKRQFKRAYECKILTEAQASYIAGFIDGEGSIMVIGRKYGAAIRLTASNTKLLVLEWLCEVTGVGQVINTRIQKDNHRAAHNWVVNAQAAEAVIRQIEPYLILKREQALLALDVQNHMHQKDIPVDKQWLLEAKARMQFLNRRGGFENSPPAGG